MNDAVRAVEAFLEAAQLNREDPLLTGSLLHFPDYGQLVMTGDLHGPRRNFDKLRRYCDLEHAGIDNRAAGSGLRRCVTADAERRAGHGQSIVPVVLRRSLGRGLRLG